MKNPLLIIISVLIALSGCTSIVLIILILQLPSHRHSAVKSYGEESIPVPERFRQLRNITKADSPSASQLQSIPASPATGAKNPGSVKKISCKERITAARLRSLFRERDIYCRKSSWSGAWANPSGGRLRRTDAKYAFLDSVVVDSTGRLVWQRFSTHKYLQYGETEGCIARMNARGWQGASDWRVPTIEELMTLLSPDKNAHGLYLSPSWNCNASDLWSCNSACDSLSVNWIWVVRLHHGRCNHGHPHTVRSLLAVRDL